MQKTQSGLVSGAIIINHKLTTVQQRCVLHDTVQAHFDSCGKTGNTAEMLPLACVRQGERYVSRATASKSPMHAWQLSAVCILMVVRRKG